MSDVNDTAQMPLTDVDRISMYPWAEPITAAAGWWAYLLRTHGIPIRRIGFRTEIAVFGDLYKETTRLANYPAEKIDRFEYLLRRVLHLRLWLKFGLGVIPSEYTFNLLLTCEYDPDRWLQCAAKHAGINPIGLGLQLPWKTAMWIDPFEVIVREGEGAPRVHIFGYEQAAKQRENERWAWENLPGYREKALAQKDWLTDYPPEQQFDKWAGQPPINGEKRKDGVE
jgi:BTG family protein